MLENQVFQLTILHVNKLIAMTKTLKLVNTYAIQHLETNHSNVSIVERHSVQKPGRTKEPLKGYKRVS